MNDIIKYGFWFLAGVAAAKAGAHLLAGQETSLRTAAVETVAQGLAAKEKVLTSVEKARENVEDIMAEARHIQAVANNRNQNQDKTDMDET